jgi:signal transduction histidine kinase
VAGAPEGFRRGTFDEKGRQLATFATAPGLDRRAARAPPGLSLSWALAVAGATAAGISCGLALSSEGVGGQLGEPIVLAMLTVWVTLSYVLCGVVAWRRRPQSRFGALLFAAGFVNIVSTRVWTTSDVPYTIGQAIDLLPPVVFLHVFLAFPDGRLRGWFVRTLVAGSYATAIGLELVRMHFGDFGAHNLLAIDSNPGLAEAVRKVQLTLASLFCLTGVAVLATRRLQVGRPLRRSVDMLVDAFALALVMIAFLFVSAAFGGPWLAQIRWAAFVTLGLAPAAFLTGLLQARLARSALGELVIELRADLAPSALRAALARALRDPSLELAYWLPEFDTYADVDGQPLDVDALGRGRATTLIDRKGAHIAALLHDPSLGDEPELLHAATAAAAIAVENARLQAELRARLEELRGSRARMIEAGQTERKRLERNLHDGAQQRLIALSLELSLLEDSLGGDPDATKRLDQARQEIALSLEELRDVARGIHPAVLSGHGLEVALESIAACASVPVRLRVELEGRPHEQLEVVVYYVVSESLANVAKHARATRATVDVARENGQMVVEVVDDGVGGADTERGSGLRGLADRVEAVGGRLRIWTPLGGGTRVKAEIPCA